MIRRRFLKGLAGIVLAGALAFPGFSAEPKTETVALNTPLQSLKKQDKRLVHSVLIKGNQQIYLIGEHHNKAFGNYENYTRIIDNENIECVFLEGLEGRIDDNYSKKINEDAELTIGLIDEKKGRTIVIDYPIAILVRENGEVIIPSLEYKDFTFCTPGANIVRLVKPKHKVQLHGVDNLQYDNKCGMGMMKKSFQTAFEKLEEANKRHKENKDYNIFDLQNFKGNFNLKNSEIIKRNLEAKMEEVKRKAPWFIDFDETIKKDPQFIQERYIRKRDEFAVKEITRLMNQDQYKRGLIIRGNCHINSMRQLLAKEGFVSSEYDPDRPAKDLDGRTYSLAKKN